MAKKSGLLDALSSILKVSPEQPQQLALQTAPQAPSLGTGLAQGAADITSLHPVWLQEYSEGVTTLPFAQWLSLKQSNPALPRQ